MVTPVMFEAPYNYCNNFNSSFMQCVFYHSVPQQFIECQNLPTDCWPHVLLSTNKVESCTIIQSIHTVIFFFNWPMLYRFAYNVDKTFLVFFIILYTYHLLDTTLTVLLTVL